MIDGKSLHKITELIMCQFHFAYKLETKLVDIITSAFQMVSEGMSGYDLFWCEYVQ